MDLSAEEIAAFEAFERKGWSRAADAYHDHWGPLSSQSAGALLDAACVDATSHVLDVASGAGYVAAAAVARGARATGVDFSEEQVALARQTYPHISFVTGAAEELPFKDASFDAVVMGFGMNHLPNPEKAVAEAWRVLRPGGWFAFSVWAKPQPREGFGIVLSAIDAHGEKVTDLPAAPPYFRFADDAEVRTVLAGAGFECVETKIIPQHWSHKRNDQVFEAFAKGAVRATAMLQAQPKAIQDRIRKEVCKDVNALRTGDYYVIPVPAALSAGMKPLRRG